MSETLLHYFHHDSGDRQDKVVLSTKSFTKLKEWLAKQPPSPEACSCLGEQYTFNMHLTSIGVFPSIINNYTKEEFDLFDVYDY